MIIILSYGDLTPQKQIQYDLKGDLKDISFRDFLKLSYWGEELAHLIVFVPTNPDKMLILKHRDGDVGIVDYSLLPQLIEQY